MTSTPGSRCNRLEAFRLTAILLIQLSVRPAAAQHPIPLPTDPSLAAYFSVSAVRDYRREIRDPNGVVRSTLAVDAGKWDTVYPFTLTRGFEPYSPPPIPTPPT